MFERIESKSPGENIQDFKEHLFYAAITAPAQGAYQFVQKASGDLLPEWKPEKPPIDSVGSLAGELTGAGAVFLAAALVSRPAMRKLAGNLAGASLSKQAVWAGLETGAAGAMVGLLQPVQPGKDFWTEKGKTSAHLGLSFGAMGATGKLLSGSGWFGAAGERSLSQSVSVNALTGASGGFMDAYLRAGIVEQRLPSAAEVFGSTAIFATLGGAYGAGEFALPSVMNSGKAALEYFRRPGKSLNLSMSSAHSAESAILGGLPAPSLEAKALAATALERPLPRFDKFEKVIASSSTPISPEALKQSTQYVERGVIAERLEDGVRLAASVKSRGFDAKTGNPLDASERFLVVDKSRDPVLKATIDDARSRFAGIKDEQILASELSSYSARILNRFNLNGQSLDSLYESMVRSNPGQLMPLGEFLRRGSGVCLQRSALMKCIGDELGLGLRLREGLVAGTGQPQAHVWTEVAFSTRPETRIYDPSVSPSARLKYSTPKEN